MHVPLTLFGLASLLLDSPVVPSLTLLMEFCDSESSRIFLLIGEIVFSSNVVEGISLGGAISKYDVNRDEEKGKAET